ncbi:ATPase family AAA domain-containing protein 1-like [Patiria miniata]|uniref:AAA+ ATPase domain-containing protein n=1 Tax=Patiria miniata TaxID=46514 RepID=A0A914ABX0_PATMI|nr:ATPase family AAA domain-containing protein 1-like [Patiria miniata]XP_038061343.1 ATPase family AAA domain-containing protein 1-like [Patiria miniata]
MPGGEESVRSVKLSLSKSEIFGLVFRLAVLGVSTYYGVRWIVKAMDPTRKQKQEAQEQAQKLMKSIGVKGVKLSDYEMSIAAQLVDPLTLSITWADIGGLETICREIKETILLPMKKKHLFKDSVLLQPPKGVLLYGPPGCGKTMLAKVIAKDAGCRFVNLQASNLTDKWYGESQKLASAVFSLAVKLQPAIIFIDEIDSFLRSRASHDHEATAMMKAQFMTMWDGLITDNNCDVILMGATNRPRDVDPAILRRMPTTFHIGLPGQRERESILKIILRTEKLADTVNLLEIADQTDGFSGSDLREMCRNACIYTMRDYMKNQSGLNSDEGEAQSAEESLRPVSMEDLSTSLLKTIETKQLQPGGASKAALPLD